MLHKLSIRTLQVFTCFCLIFFLGQKLVVPLLHDHHSAVHGVHESIDASAHCMACDIEAIASLFETTVSPSFITVLICFGWLLATVSVLPALRTVVFSSLRAPPALD